jgi:hypothetical protein
VIGNAGKAKAFWAKRFSDSRHFSHEFIKWRTGGGRGAHPLGRDCAQVGESDDRSIVGSSGDYASAFKRGEARIVLLLNSCLKHSISW